MLTRDTLIASLPSSGLRRHDSWLFSPQPLELDTHLAQKISRLGHPLAHFQKASESIYQRSAKGNLPTWISEILDAGKPKWMIETQRSSDLRGILPRIIRPDLILTESATTEKNNRPIASDNVCHSAHCDLALTELDSVPGGMGITSWLSQIYSDHGYTILGGPSGIIDSFKSLLSSSAEILISEESSDYQLEMEYLARECSVSTTDATHPSSLSVKSAEDFSSHNFLQSDSSSQPSIYRFFEWFDWEQIPESQQLARSPKLTPPCKPHLEEKLWLAMLHTPSLRNIWQRELRGNHLRTLLDLIPYGWIVDPTPLPPLAAIPKLNVHSWDEVMQFSQKQRQLVLKISGFSELAWGARGVDIGHDLPSTAWKSTLQDALTEHKTQPRILQEFKSGKLIEHPYFDPHSGEIKSMIGRVRLCPYYFTSPDYKSTSLAGCLATIVPADKKKIHGMSDAILVPCSIRQS